MTEKTSRSWGMSLRQQQQMIDDFMHYQEVKFAHPLNADAHLNAHLIAEITRRFAIDCSTLDTVRILRKVALELQKSEDPQDRERSTLYAEIASSFAQFSSFIQLLPSDAQ